MSGKPSRAEKLHHPLYILGVVRHALNEFKLIDVETLPFECEPL